MGCVQSSQDTRSDTRTSQNNECVICFSASSNVIIYPCGHYQICSSCAHRLRKWRIRYLNLKTNNFFKRITCPTCFEPGGMIKIFPDGNHKCRVCKEKFVDALILPCSHFEICYECCSDFTVNRLQINVLSEYTLLCPICRGEGGMFIVS